MKQPTEDSNQTEETPEQTAAEQNSTAAETAAETHTEQPAQESETDPNSTVDEGLAKLRERLGIKDEKETKKPDPKQQTTTKTESKEDVTQGEDPEAGDDPDEIELENGTKLIAVTVDGITVHTTPEKAAEVKNGLLRQSDYTKKTQALTEEKKKIESERSVFYRQIRAFQALQEEIALAGGFDAPEP